MNKLEKEKIFNFTEPSDEMFAKLEDPNYEWGTHFLSPVASEADKVKYQLCIDIIKFRENHNLTNEKLADILSVDLNKVLKVIYRHYKDLDFEELSNYNEKLAASVNEKVQTYYSNSYAPNSYYTSAKSSANRSVAV